MKLLTATSPVSVTGPTSSRSSQAQETDAAGLVTLRHGLSGRVSMAKVADAAPQNGTRAAVNRRARTLRDALYSGLPAHPAARPHRRWLTENARLISAALKDVKAFAPVALALPAVPAPDGPSPRVCHLMRAYLDTAEWQFDETLAIAFLAGAQEEHELTMSEVWSAKQALQLLLLERLVDALTGGDGRIPVVVASLRAVAESQWKHVFAAVNPIDPVLSLDPARAYAGMEEVSQGAYREAVSRLAARSGRSESDVARAAVDLALGASQLHRANRLKERRCHVGFYLIDRGLPLLKARLGCRPSLRQRVTDVLAARPAFSYLSALAAVTAVVLLGTWSLAGGSWAAVAGVLLLLMPAMQAAVDITNAAATTLVRARALPKLDFSTGVPYECTTLVAVPALLLNEANVRELVLDLEIRYLANRDANILFALVTNSADSRVRPEDPDDALRLCERLIGELNERYGTTGHTPFYLLHRFRRYNPSEERWIGWERKRGKLLELNQLLRGARDQFPVKVGNIEALRRVRYVLVLDSDTELPRDAARRLAGTIAHPLNRAVVDPVTRTVVEGYGILQPRIGITTQSATRSWLANLYSGDTGFDIYTRAVSDVYQDLLGEGIFTGKGIYEVDVFRDTLERRFPENTLLSHDLIEGLFARAGLVSDVELLDDYPAHFGAYCRRKHRWMRGDWQILRWLRSRVPDGQRQLVPNPLGAMSRWKILDNLRRTLVEPATLALLLVAWFALPAPGLWTTAVVGLLLAPAYWRVLLSFANAPWGAPAFGPWAVATITAFRRSHAITGLRLVYLLHDALLAADAVFRTLARMFVTRRGLLEWETAAEASLRSKGALDVHLRRASLTALLLVALVALLRPEALVPAAPLLAAWIVADPAVRWLNRAPSRGPNDLSVDDAGFLRQQALRTWMFFATFSTRRNHWLVPDSVHVDGACSDKVSPTNIAMLLNARIAAVHLGYLTVPEFAVLTRRTLATVRRLARFKGHLLNWYDTSTLDAIAPRFVSTVDSGNLAAALWALKQSALGFIERSPGPETLWDGIADVARLLGEEPHPVARALAERVLKARANWRHAPPELETLVSHFAATAHGDARRWSEELLVRLRYARVSAGGFAPPDLEYTLRDLAAEADALVDAMDFGFLYDRRRKVLSVGYDLANDGPEPSAYDLLASEARSAAFVAVAKGDIPQESWFHLGRTLVAAQAERVLLSWTGTLFEYLMPALWFRHRPHTIMHDTMRAALAVQQKFARRRGVPWGFSESACIVPGSTEYGYAPCGLPDLALKPLDGGTVVVSPYSTFLALLVDRAAALANLRALKRTGCVGTFGFHEAIDYSGDTPAIVRSWMAHHQGMSLIAAAEVLRGGPMQQAFHNEPQVRATERLLDECVPATVVPDDTRVPKVRWPEDSAA